MSWQGDRQSGAATAQGGGVGCAHLNIEQVDERQQQAFGSAQRQVINLFERRHAGDGDVAIGIGGPALTGLFLVDPKPQHFLTHPQRQASALHESRVI